MGLAAPYLLPQARGRPREPLQPPKVASHAGMAAAGAGMPTRPRRLTCRQIRATLAEEFVL